MIRDSNPNYRITPDSGVYRNSPKMLWIYYIVGVSHYAECRENRPADVGYETC